MRDEQRRTAAADVEGGQTASATECTGLVPALPEAEDGLAALAELYDIAPPEARGGHK